jgi:hypothetical protein
MSEAMDQVATDVLADLMGVEVVDGAPAEGEQPEAVAAPEAHEATEETPDLDLDAEIPEELEAFLNEPDFEPTAEEVEAVQLPESADDDAEEWQENEDERVTALKRELVKERKRAEHEKSLRVSSQQSAWKKEAVRYFPLSEPQLANINASSRRAYLREAKAAHEAMKPQVQKFLDREKKRLQEEAKANAHEAWGKPQVGPGAPPSDAKSRADALDKARATGSLLNVLKERLKSDQI